MKDRKGFIIIMVPFVVLIFFLVLGVLGWDSWLVNWPFN